MPSPSERGWHGTGAHANAAIHEMHGALIVDKPSGPSSHDVVARVRRAIRTRRIGHTGTLDPLATGVLVLLVGRATRLARFIGAGEKRYDATVRFGFATDTYDVTGRPFATAPAVSVRRPAVGRSAIEAALDSFRGTTLQSPPPFSAKRIGGIRAYDLARRQAPVSPSPVTVTVHAIELVGLEGERAVLRLAVSSGFYVRSLAHDLGIRLGCGAHLEALRRTATGGFGLDWAMPLEALEAEGPGALNRLVGMADLLPDVPAVVLTEHGARRAAHGATLRDADVSRPGEGPPAPGRVVRLLDPSGELLAVAERGPDAALHPVVVLV